MNKNKLEMQKTVMTVWQAIDKNEDGFVNWTVFKQGLPLKERETYLNYIKENWFVEQRKGSGRPGILIKPKYLRNASYGSKPKASPKPRVKIDKNDPLNNKRWVSSVIAANYLDIKESSLRTNLVKKLKNRKTNFNGKNRRVWLMSDLVEYNQNRNTNRLRGVNKVQAKKPIAVERLLVNDFEKVNHPKHYNPGKIEVINAIEDWDLGFSEGNVIKYIVRAGNKSDNRLEDLQKALFYLKRIIQNAE